MGRSPYSHRGSGVYVQFVEKAGLGDSGIRERDLTLLMADNSPLSAVNSVR